jgi:hypothetical protein
VENMQWRKREKLECMVVVAEANGVGRNKVRHQWSKKLMEA